tara:strand:- start:3953 stop:4894 length:942 start_codon:yes stop_codon:yes gene_type:complete
MSNIKLADRIKEKSHSIGTGRLDLDGAFAGSSRFSEAYVSGDSFFYAISDGTDYEVGSGIYAFDTVNHYIEARFPAESSNSDNLVNFNTGLKEVYVTYPGKFSVFTASGQADFKQPDASGVAFWGSEQILSYDENIVWNNQDKYLGILGNPEYPLDVRGQIEKSAIRSSGVIVGDSGVMFSGVSVSYSGGRQLEPFLRSELDDTTGTDDVFSLSGLVDQRLLFKKQPPSQVFAGPSGDCGCVSDYPVFRPLRFDDIQGVNQIINSSGNLAIPTFNLYTDNDISADQAGVLAFSTGDNYLMIANGTSWVKIQLS